ncbi:ETEC_3214 domain-containing protein [Neptunicella marina]|uniref:Uncharacterized protein n=1 Tax=Neptunicella marina TaxID=2125989 RepID=A0A8J6LZY5_9ALTE|nr:ETEC_3214 domain-containing protein [Neptunicella marina]MBC3766580.1 hypothetical protein [Neptunicella marina]
MAEDANRSRFSLFTQQFFNRTLFKRVVFYIPVAVITLGQFNDSKELSLEAYNSIKTNFTHSLEYEKLSHLNIGRTISFVEDYFGPPEVVKVSQQNPDVHYQYYNIGKAVVTIMNHDGRVSGFTVIPTQTDFDPVLPYLDKSLAQINLGTEFFSEPEFFFDAFNLVYFAQGQNLGKQFIFLTWMAGIVEYGRFSRLRSDGELIPLNTAITQISGINESVLANQQDKVAQAIVNLQMNQPPNFYAFTELDTALIPESLLTRFEFKTYFGVHNG